MSFILDALRKSEHERERRALPGLVEAPATRVVRPSLAWILGGVGVLLAVNAAILAWVLLRPPAGPPTEPPAVEAAPIAAAPTALASPTLADNGRVRSLAAEAAATEPGQEVPEPPPVNHAQMAPPTPAASPPPSAPGVARPPTLRQLPAALAAVLPPLNIDLHVYSPIAAQRFVIINGQRVHEGGVLREGMLVEQITAEGVILNHQGTRFTLSRE